MWLLMIFIWTCYSYKCSGAWVWSNLSYQLNVQQLHDYQSITQVSVILHVILTNVPAFMRDSGTIETGLSDHCLVYTMLNTKLLRPRSKSIFKRSLKNFDQTAFLDDLSRVPFCAAYVFEDRDDVYWCWGSSLTKCLMITPLLGK